MERNKIEELYNFLKDTTKAKLDANVGKNSWIGTGGTADLLVSPKNTEELVEIIKTYNRFCNENKIFAKNNEEIKESSDDMAIYSEAVHSWKLIDAAGLRNFSIGGAEVSEIHCNFLVNKGGATASDFENLGEYVIEKVYQKFKVKLEWEVERIGDFARENE